LPDDGLFVGLYYAISCLPVSQQHCTTKVIRCGYWYYMAIEYSLRAMIN